MIFGPALGVTTGVGVLSSVPSVPVRWHSQFIPVVQGSEREKGSLWPATDAGEEEDAEEEEGDPTISHSHCSSCLLWLQLGEGQQDSGTLLLAQEDLFPQASFFLCY